MTWHPAAYVHAMHFDRTVSLSTADLAVMRVTMARFHLSVHKHLSYCNFTIRKATAAVIAIPSHYAESHDT